MILNVWAARWNTHLIEVRNHFFVAELLIDGQRVDRAPGVFRHDVRGEITTSRARGARLLCANRECRHPNKPEARFCSNCGEVLATPAPTVPVRATVEFGFPPPRVNCRIFLNGEELFKEGPP